jgi:hypothetical protein
MPGSGGIGQQVADNLFELGQSTVKSAVKAGTDIVGESIEQITSAPSSVGAQQAVDKKPEANSAQVEAERKQRDKRQFEMVRRELDTYIQWKQQQEAQMAQEKAAEEKRKEQEEVFEKNKKESFVQSLLKRVKGGSHGEMSKQKE